MSNALNPVSLKAFEATAAKAAAYLDACDNGGTHVTLDPDYYQACGCLLSKMFSLFDARHTFPDLLNRSAAAREIAESVGMGHRLETSLLVFYPQLAAVLGRAAARGRHA